MSTWIDPTRRLISTHPGYQRTVVEEPDLSADGRRALVAAFVVGADHELATSWVLLPRLERLGSGTDSSEAPARDGGGAGGRCA